MDSSNFDFVGPMRSHGYAWHLCALLTPLCLAAATSYGQTSSPTSVSRPAVSKAEQDHLLQGCRPLSEAVIALNDAIMTAQAAARATSYSGPAHVEQAPREVVRPADLQEMDVRLQADQDRFTLLYRAHFGQTRDRQGRLVPLGPEELRLAADATERRRACDLFVEECLAARAETGGLVARARSSLDRLRKEAGSAAVLSEPTPRFVQKPPSTLLADGTATGLIFGVAVADGPGMLPRGFDYETGCYERYDVDYRVSPIKAAAARGRRTQVIIPCAVHDWMYCDPPWFEQHRGEPITRLGAPARYTGQWNWQLDFNHPAVREMFAEYLTTAAKRYVDNPSVLMFTTAWEAELDDRQSGAWGQWQSGGRAPASVQAFRDHLRKKCETIAKLNEAWQSGYASFEAIEPPADLAVGPEPQRSALVKALSSGDCPPLYYEFHRFLKDMYADYLVWCYRKIKAANPQVPVSVSPSYGQMDGYLCTGRDSFRWAEEACDLYGSEDHSSLEEVFNWSIHRALHRTTGIFEFVWNGPECWSDPPEEIVRASASRNLWRLVAWDRKVIALFGGQDTYGGAAHNYMLIPQSGSHLLRRSAGIIDPLLRKLRSMEDVWLDAPILEPKIAMLKPSTSQICAWPWQAVEQTAQGIHRLLYGRNYHYAFVPEEYVVSGRKALDRYRVLILPYATHFPDGLTQRILPWVESGGTLIVAGVAGGFTPYGKKDGRLMAALFGKLDYMTWDERRWKIDVRHARPDVDIAGAEYAETFEASCGRGRALMAVRADDLRPGGSAAERCCGLIDRAAPRIAWAEGAELEMVLRQDGRGLHVVLLNPNLKDAARAKIHLAAEYRQAVDRGIEGGWSVPLHDEGNGQVFELTLGPGEGTVISLAPRAQ